MSAPKHTPGPWKCVFRNAVRDLHQISIRPVKHPGGGERLRIASVAPLGSDGGVANARLIVASPELLCELQAAQQIIRNALAVMTNEQKEEWGRLNWRGGVVGEGITRANEREAVIAKAGGAT